MDIYSRYVVGWMVASCESSALAKRLISDTVAKQGVKRDQLTIHADRGSSMKSKVVAQLMADLGITKTHSRPSVSNDNPYSESQFKTLKYRPGFPDRFGSIEDARSFCQDFFRWYNHDHKHSGIAYLTPKQVHYHESSLIIEGRKNALEQAFKKNPKRFKNRCPKPPQLPTVAWINKPMEQKSSSSVATDDNCPSSQSTEAVKHGKTADEGGDALPRTDCDIQILSKLQKMKGGVELGV